MTGWPTVTMAAPVAPFKVKRTKTLLNLCSLVLLGLGIAMIVLLGNLLGLLPLATGVCGVLGLSFAWYRALVLFTLIAWGTLVLCGIEIAMLVAHPDNVLGWLIWISCSLFALPAAVLSSTLHLLAGASHRRLCPHPCPRTRTRPCPRSLEAEADGHRAHRAARRPRGPRGRADDGHAETRRRRAARHCAVAARLAAAAAHVAGARALSPPESPRHPR